MFRAPKAVTAFGPETHPSYLHLSSHPAATWEPDGLCGNQRYCRELLTMGIMDEFPDQRLLHPSVRKLIHPTCTYASIQQQLENQTAYVVTNTIVMSSWRWA